MRVWSVVVVLGGLASVVACRPEIPGVRVSDPTLAPPDGARPEAGNDVPRSNALDAAVDHGVNETRGDRGPGDGATDVISDAPADAGVDGGAGSGRGDAGAPTSAGDALSGDLDAGSDLVPAGPQDAGRGDAGAADSGRPPPPNDAGLPPAPNDAGAGEAGSGDARSNPDAPREDAAADHSNEPPTAWPPRPGDLAIVEVLVNPAGTDTGREWIEIKSLATVALDLRELVVADSANEVAVPAGTLAPGALLLLGQSSAAASNGGAPVQLTYGTRIGLNNDGDSISLCAGPCAAGVLLDGVSWGATLGADYDGHALVIPPRSGVWCAAAEPFGTAGSFGTPGAPNAPCP